MSKVNAFLALSQLPGQWRSSNHSVNVQLHMVTRVTNEKFWAGLLRWCLTKGAVFALEDKQERPSKCSKQREQHMQRPCGSFQELLLQGVMERVVQEKAAELGRGQRTGGRLASAWHCLLHTLFIWLIHTHPLDLSSGISFSESLFCPMWAE